VKTVSLDLEEEEMSTLEQLTHQLEESGGDADEMMAADDQLSGTTERESAATGATRGAEEKQNSTRFWSAGAKHIMKHTMVGKSGASPGNTSAAAELMPFHQVILSHSHSTSRVVSGWAGGRSSQHSDARGAVVGRRGVHHQAEKNSREQRQEGAYTPGSSSLNHSFTCGSLSGCNNHTSTCVNGSAPGGCDWHLVNGVSVPAKWMYPNGDLALGRHAVCAPVVWCTASHQLCHCH
jgi:hypothetical protein